MTFDELKQDHEYIATDRDGEKYRGIYADGFFFCVYPTFTRSGSKNNLISFEEPENK